MSFWVLVQVLANLILFAGVAILWTKLHRPPKDDPRLSRGLQLLQSKISVLEDLSDRTETQVNQLMLLMEQKTKEIQTQLLSADKQIQKVEMSMGRSLEVAKIFQDKIPHQEIIERQNTIKYVKAAKMAHQGASINDISAAVDLSQGEIEFIAKVNRDQLQFSLNDLPDWAKEDLDFPQVSEAAIQQLNNISQAAPEAQQALSQLGNQFRKAISTPPLQPQAETPVAKPRVLDVGVRKVVFPKIDISKNLG